MKSKSILTQNSVWTECSRDIALLVQKELSYKHTEWKYVFGKRKQVIQIISLVREDKEKGVYFFPTGLVPRVLRFLRKRNIEFIYKSEIACVEHDEPLLKGIEFRDYQKEFIDVALKEGRGVLQSATGTGKSIIIAGIMSAFSQEKILFLVHTQDLVTQMKKDLVKFFGKEDIGEWTGGTRKMNRIVVATIQSFSKVAWEYTDYFDVCFVDECFFRKTKITMSDESFKTIENVKIGDFVKTRKGSKQVLRTFKNKVPLSRLCKVKLSNGKEIVCSIDHVFKTPDGEILAKDLIKNQLLTSSVN